MTRLPKSTNKKLMPLKLRPRNLRRSEYLLLRRLRLIPKRRKLRLKLTKKLRQRLMLLKRKLKLKPNKLIQTKSVPMQSNLPRKESLQKLNKSRRTSKQTRRMLRLPKLLLSLSRKLKLKLTRMKRKLLSKKRKLKLRMKRPKKKKMSLMRKLRKPNSRLRKPRTNSRTATAILLISQLQNKCTSTCNRSKVNWQS